MVLSTYPRTHECTNVYYMQPQQTKTNTNGMGQQQKNSANLGTKTLHTANHKNYTIMHCGIGNEFQIISMQERVLQDDRVGT